MSKINKTTLKHDTVRCKILGAMRSAMNKGYAQYVTNRKGDNYLRVARLINCKGIGRAFIFVDKNGNDVTETVYSGLSV